MVECDSSDTNIQWLILTFELNFSPTQQVLCRLSAL